MIFENNIVPFVNSKIKENLAKIEVHQCNVLDALPEVVTKLSDEDLRNSLKYYSRVYDYDKIVFFSKEITRRFGNTLRDEASRKVN